MAAGPGRTGSPGEAGPGPTAPRPRTATIARTLRRRAGRPLPWTTPRLVRALTALCLAALLGTGAAAAAVLTGARADTDAIGHRDAPQAARAADLYFALSDMDAQAANLLLLGADPDFAPLRRQTLDTYEQRRTQADADLQQAAEAAAGDPAGQRAVHTVLGQLGGYEALVARAELLEEQAGAPAGQPSPAALDAYRQATDLLRQRLLPAADEVGAASGATVDRVYGGGRAGLATGRWWILGTGLLALAALAGLQRLLTVRYRRLVNPPLAAVTLLTVVALTVGLHLVTRADEHLVVAKSNAYDSVIALSRARAVAYDLNADESRYLTDPARAAAYQQSFLDKTQAVARVDGATLADYNAGLATVAGRHRADHAAVPFGGFLGTELRNITFPGEQEAAERVLAAFQAYQLDDRRIRELRDAGRLKEAVTLNTGLAPGQSNYDFERLARAIGDTLDVNARAMDEAVAKTGSDLDTTTAALGALTLAASLALTALGVRPRLREYR
ncbi:hypothetical protein OG535_36525 [Kitasatospora sp. NBC_00085]|uniref:hypothetical protein n=1 Tax=unclassified Kitasatospora TaxID=2633591 RepID=UPI00324D2005